MIDEWIVDHKQVEIELQRYMDYLTLEGRTRMARAYLEETWKEEVPSLMDKCAFYLISKDINFKNANIPVSIIDHVVKMSKFSNSEWQQESADTHRGRIGAKSKVPPSTTFI